MTEPFWQTDDVTLYSGDARKVWPTLPPHLVDAICTSPPFYGLRDYGHPDQLGLEPTPQEYITKVADLLTDWARHVLRPGGSLWLNLGDTYATRTADIGHNGSGAQLRGNARRRRAGTADRRVRPTGPVEKCLLMIPERVAWALIERGWVLRNKVVWAKPNAMPTSATDRLANKWEFLFHLTLQPRYAYDLDAIRQPHTREWVPGQNGHTDRGPMQPGHRTRDGLDDAAPHPEGANPGDYWEPNWTDDDQRWYDAAVQIAGCDVWKLPTRPYHAAHFAVYPEDLVHRPILATVPEHVCRACNTPRRRIVERIRDIDERPAEAGPTKGHIVGNPGANSIHDARNHHDAIRRETRTVGWTDCGCDAGWRAGIVADPFAGAGTTAARARKLGRRSLLVELNDDYCGLIRDRLTSQGVLVFDDESGVS